VNLSARSSYGSGFPIPGYLTEKGSVYYLTTVENQLRMPAYFRTDLRINKSWRKDRWKLTLYGELINLTNHPNYLFDSFNGYSASTHQAHITLDTMFPILPSAGLTLEK
jgi:TonB dependent receptor